MEPHQQPPNYAYNPNFAAPAPRPRPTSTRGPKILTISGIVLTVIGAIALGLGIFALVKIIPTGIITGDGSPGEEVLVTSEVPGTATLSATAGTSYTLWHVYAYGPGTNLRTSSITVTAPDGKELLIRPSSLSGSMDRNEWHARTFAEFHAKESGDYRITVTSEDQESMSRVYLSVATEMGSFMKGIFGTIGLFFVGIGGGIIGLILAITGGVWWASRKRNARAAVA